MLKKSVLLKGTGLPVPLAPYLQYGFSRRGTLSSMRRIFQHPPKAKHIPAWAGTGVPGKLCSLGWRRPRYRMANDPTAEGPTHPPHPPPPTVISTGGGAFAAEAEKPAGRPIHAVSPHEWAFAPANRSPAPTQKPASLLTIFTTPNTTTSPRKHHV